MKKTLKLISLALVLLMLAMSFMACGGKEEETTGGGEVNTNTNSSNALPAKDLGGKDFRVLDANDHADMHINYALELGGTAVESALYQRDANLKARNNVNFVYEQIDNLNKTGIDAFTNTYASGDSLYDLVVSTASGTRLATLACSGYFYDLEALPTLDLSGKWWSSQMNEAMKLGGKMYFTTGDIMASVYDAPMCVYANKTLLERNQIDDDLYQLVRDKKWTVEYLTTVTNGMDADINDDSVMSAADDFFGVAAQPVKMTTSGMLVGMGFDMSYILNDTTIVVNNDLEQLSNLTDKLKNILTYMVRDVNADVIDKCFKNDRSLFLVHLVEAANHNLRDMASDYQILPMPLGSENQENYRSYINGWVDCFIAVPNFEKTDTEYAEFVGYMLESMARESYDVVRPIAFDQVVMYQSTRDPGAIEMLNIIYDTLYLDFQGIYDFGTASTVLAQVVFEDKDLASSWAGVQGTITSKAGEISNQWINAGK